MPLCTLAVTVGPHAVYTGVTYIGMDRVAPRFSIHVRRFDWIDSIDSIHPFPTASSLSRSNPSSSASEATATGGGGDYCSRRW